MQKIQKKFLALFASFFLLLILLIMPVYLTALQALQNNAIRLHREVLTAGIQQLENEMITIWHMANMIYAESTIRTLAFLPADTREPSPQDAYKMQQALKAYSNITQMADAISDAGLVLRNGIILASNRLHLSPEDFYGNFMRVDGSNSYLQWQEAISSSERLWSIASVHVHTLAGERDALIFSISLSSYPKWSNYFYAVLDIDTVVNMLSVPDMLNYGTLILFDNESNVLLQAGNIPSNGISVDVEGDLYHVQLLIESSYFSHDLATTRNSLICGMTIFLFCSILLAMLYSQKSARPLEQMLDTASRVLADNSLDVFNEKTEYDFMIKFIQCVDRRLKENYLSIANQVQLIRENLLERILLSDLHQTQCEILDRRYFLDFPFPCRMILIKLDNISTLSADEFSSIRVFILDSIKPILPETSITHFTSNILVIFKKDDGASSICATASLIADKISERNEFNYHIGISRPFESIDDIGRVFRLLQHGMRLSESMIYIDEEKELQNSSAVMTPHIIRFQELLLRMQPEAAAKILSDDIHEIRKRNNTIEADVQQLFYAYRFALLQVIDEISDIAEKITLPTYASNESLDIVFSGLFDAVLYVCKAIEQQRMEKYREIGKAIREAIAENLSNSDLSVAMIAEHFSLSQNALQKIMHECTGKSFFDYVIHCRMQLAKSLLEETMIPIADIVRRCGYASVNSFYKAFQKNFGISPNSMRASKMDHL